MGESILKPVVISLTFVAIGILLIGTTNRVQYSNLRSNSDLDVNEDFRGKFGFNYTLWDDSQGVDDDGILVNSSMALTQPPPYLDEIDNVGNMIGYYRISTSGTGIDPNVSIRGDVAIDLIRDNELFNIVYGWGEDVSYYEQYLDFLLIGQNQGDWWGAHWRWNELSYETIIQNERNNMSSTALMVGNEAFTIFVIGPENNLTFANNLYNDNYTVFVGRDWLDDTVGKISMGKIVSRLLTFSLPGVPKVIGFLIGFPFWMVIAFAVMTLISRFIPTIPGG